VKPAERALERLRDPADPALAELARLVVAETTATPLRSIASPRWIASQLVAALEAGARGPRFRDWLVERIASEREKWKEDGRKLSSVVPEEAVRPLREVLRRPYSPAENLALRVLDQPALRALVGEILVDVLHRFRARVQLVDSGFLGGIGQRAARRGRGLLGGLAEVAGVAEGLVGAVKEEVEFAIDSKVRDFARQATSDVIQLIARDLASPARAASFAEMRSDVLDVLLDTPIADLAAEAGKLEPEGIVDSLVAGVRSALARPELPSDLEARIAAAIAATGDGTLGAWLAEVELEEVWTSTTVELVEGRLRAVAGTKAFAAWWTELHR
jgi:hypothetical protein